MNFYNENDPYPAQWLRNLIAADLIATGTVDERSIVDLEAQDLDGFSQAHFFAGIGVWSYALRLAGWPDDRPIWTGSCPCQPFSAAGKRLGASDQRHLWPDWFRLIRLARPPIILGEQVASSAGLEWFDAVHSDLEGEGYAVAAADLCAASVGAPHIRQRLFFVAHSKRGSAERWRYDVGTETHRVEEQARERQWLWPDSGSGLKPRLVGHPDEPGLQGRIERGHSPGELPAGAAGVAGRLADSDGRYPSAEREQRSREQRLVSPDGRSGFWSSCDWLPCRDGKTRPVEPGTFPLAHGTPARVGRLRAYGNALVAPLATEFVRAVMETLP